MIAAVDATALTLLVNPGAEPPTDPNTGKPTQQARERIELFVSEVDSARGTIIVPTPALAEVLVRAGDAGPQVLDRMNRSARFKIAEFDVRAAVEVAAMTRQAIRDGDKKGGEGTPWQKVKYDRQIIAIARVNNASAIYSDDRNIATFGTQAGLKVVRTWELPLPETKEDLFTTFGVPLEAPVEEIGPAVDDFGAPTDGDDRRP